MIYVKFDDNNLSTSMQKDCSAEELKDFVAVPDDGLFGKRLVKTKNGVKEFSEKEYAAEAKEIDKRQKSIVIDNIVRAKLAETDHLAFPDHYESLSKADQGKIKSYRDALRNVKNQKGYPDKVDFPDALET